MAETVVGDLSLLFDAKIDQPASCQNRGVAYSEILHHVTTKQNMLLLSLEKHLFPSLAVFYVV